MNHRILVSYGETSILASTLGVSMPTVRSALRGSSRTVLSDSIRQLALERGGVQVRSTKNGSICVHSTAKAVKRKNTSQQEEVTMKAFLMYLAEINGMKITDLENPLVD